MSNRSRSGSSASMGPQGSQMPRPPVLAGSSGNLPSLGALQAPVSGCHKFDRRKDYDFDLAFDQSNFKLDRRPMRSDSQPSPIQPTPRRGTTSKATPPGPPTPTASGPAKGGARNRTVSAGPDGMQTLSDSPVLPPTLSALPPLVSDIPLIHKPSPEDLPDGEKYDIAHVQRQQAPDAVTEHRKLVDAEREQQRQASQGILSERQKIAYVGLCYLLFIELETRFDVRHKEAMLATSSYLNFVRKSMRKLYSHMQLDESEQRMIEQMSRHNVKTSDLTSSLVSEGETIVVTSEQKLSVVNDDVASIRDTLFEPGSPAAVNFEVGEDLQSDTAVNFGLGDTWEQENPFEFPDHGGRRSTPGGSDHPPPALPPAAVTSPTFDEWDLAMSIDPFKAPDLHDHNPSASTLFSSPTSRDANHGFGDVNPFLPAEHRAQAQARTQVNASEDNVEGSPTTSPVDAAATDDGDKPVVESKPSTPPKPKPTDLITIDIKKTIVLDMFLLFLTDNVYDARARYFLRRLAECLDLDWVEVLRLEHSITEQLKLFEMADATNDDADDAEPGPPDAEPTLTTDDGDGVAPSGSPTTPNSPVVRSPVRDRHLSGGKSGLSTVETLKLHADRMSRYNKKEKKRRWVIMGLATIGGGLVLGLSTGLLAPAIGAGLGAAFATIGVSGTTAFFGSIGGAALITTSGALAGSSLAGIKMERRTRGISTFEFLTVRDRKRVSLVLTVPGWLTTDDDGTLPFSVIDEVVGDQYALFFEPEMLRELGSILKMLAGEVLSTATVQILQYTMLHGLLSALTWPLTLSKIGYLVDNPWSIGLDRTRKAGAILADVLLQRAQGYRPITLIGYSLGARLIFYCLLELAKSNAFGIIEDVYLFGAPVTASLEDWRLCASVVGGRFVNSYARNDWVLGFLYRYTNLNRGVVAGLMPVEGVSSIENIDISDTLDGHMSYRTYMPRLLKLVGFEVTSDEFLDPDADDVPPNEGDGETPREGGGAAAEEGSAASNPRPPPGSATEEVTAATPPPGLPASDLTRSASADIANVSRSSAGGSYAGSVAMQTSVTAPSHQRQTSGNSRSLFGSMLPFSRGAKASTTPTTVMGAAAAAGMTESSLSPAGRARTVTGEPLDDMELIRQELEAAGCVVREIKSTLPKMVIDPKP
ncbi:hypothetical protein IWQ60_001615 [Tieghemiomyces parasiticus]|uniref:DUF726-domain-containing protein n=1 Tax=Tieghemiomyces parasiticus TaxID=78921 RepID=A0A9W8AKW3_9FUNG|nr:hypothetical protein IWQ60_001615 [Tieghemiomyces parasiticus]